MSRIHSRARQVANGVSFLVTAPDRNTCECLISADALYWLSRDFTGTFGPIEIFEAHESEILDVASRLASEKMESNLLRLERRNFP